MFQHHPRMLSRSGSIGCSARLKSKIPLLRTRCLYDCRNGKAGRMEKAIVNVLVDEWNDNYALLQLMVFVSSSH